MFSIHRTLLLALLGPYASTVLASAQATTSQTDPSTDPSISSPVACVYVASSNGSTEQINGYAALPNGSLTAIPGSPFPYNVNYMAVNSAVPMTLDQVRAELKGAKGKRYWRSVDELADTAEFQAAVEREFPGSAQEWVDPVSRRGFMKLMGASLALAGLAGCTKQPDEPIYPYVKQPEDLILGKPMYFATAHPFVTGAVPEIGRASC